MAMHALVVGSKTADLQGPIGDALQIAAVLREVGFEVDLRTSDDDASRAGILDGYERLIANVEDRDAAVVYYSGHGVRVRASGAATDGAATDVPRAIQALVPTDFAKSTIGDFRGILDLELSILLARLTRRTRNATVILDCCHAAAMSRDVQSRPKGLPHPCDVDIEGHLARIRAKGFEADLLAPTGNQHAVRLVAAGQSESAYERSVGEVFVGTFTESLVLALRQARGQRLTWDALGRKVRERVLTIHPMQRPDIEGPRQRYLFDVEQAPRAGAISIVAGTEPKTGVLRAGRLHDVRPGNQYAVVPNGAVDALHPIGTATVTNVTTTESTVALQLTGPTVELPVGAQAILTRSTAPRRPIWLIADAAAREMIAKALLATNRFVISDDAGETSLLAIVKLEAGQLELLSPSGVAVVPASKWPGDAIERLVTNLRMLTAAQSLRELESESDALPDSAVELAWGRVENGEPVELLTSGELLAVGMKVFLKVTNRHPLKRKLYISVFDIGVAQRIQLLTNAWPGGYELDPDETFTLGQDASGRLVGLDLGWSNAVPGDMVRSESLVVIATEVRCDLSALETPGARSLWMSGTTRSAMGENQLQQLVRQAQYGSAITRDLNTGAEVQGHLVRHIGFELSPWRLPPRGKGFLLDDRPPESMLVFKPRGLLPSSRKLAIRITDLTIQDTRALFGSSDIRIDTLVVTRSTTSGVEPYHPATRRFKDIKDGQPLPLDNMLVYHGDATDFVDLQIWVSRDRDDSIEFSKLLKEQANSAEFKEAAAALLAIIALSTVAAPAVAAVGAVATLSAIAWRVLSNALPKSIGLYQTSLLAGEGAGFGQGRHPPDGLLRAQGFSFGYEVVAVD